MIQVTSSKFRSNISEFFTRADEGENVVIQRRGKPSYILVRLCDDDFVMTPQLEERIEKGRKEYAEGKTITITSHQQLDDLLDSLYVISNFAPTNFRKVKSTVFLTRTCKKGRVSVDL